MMQKQNKTLKAKSYKLKAAQGQVALSLILMIGGIMIIVGATLAFVVVGFLNSTYGFRDAAQALSLAESGVQDAMMQLARNNKFSSTGYCVPNTSSPPCSGASATVTVTNPSSAQATIVSSAASSNRHRSVQAVVSISGSGQVSLLSWQILQ